MGLRCFKAIQQSLTIPKPLGCPILKESIPVAIKNWRFCSRQNTKDTQEIIVTLNFKLEEKAT
jgi:hypothetical protein